jgi:predicted RNase H-like HicB family nuclease
VHKYEIIIYWSNEDQVFVAEMPQLPGCMAHGSTPEAALAHAQEAIQLWIDTARESPSSKGSAEFRFSPLGSCSGCPIVAEGQHGE